MGGLLDFVRKKMTGLRRAESFLFSMFIYVHVGIVRINFGASCFLGGWWIGWWMVLSLSLRDTMHTIIKKFVCRGLLL